MYDNGTKQTMRNWTWNRICEFIPKCLRPTQTALYLSGADDFDRPVAIRHGFTHSNLVAVDRSEEVIRDVRSAGGIGICGNLYDILINRPLGKTPGIIIADLTSGIYPHTTELFELLHGQPGAVIAVNLMRARDKRGAKLGRVFHKNHAWVRDFSQLFNIQGDIDLTKHRSFLLFMYHWANLLIGMRGDFDLRYELTLKKIRESSPSIASYRSKDGGNVFDLIVFRTCINSDDDDYAEFERGLAQTRAAGSPRKSKKLRQRIAAFKAVRTRRELAR